MHSWKVEHSITQFENWVDPPGFVVRIPPAPLGPHLAPGPAAGPPRRSSGQLICRLVALTTSPHLRVSLSMKALNACGVLGGGGIRKPLV